jgi:hypothetical protein
MSRLVFAIDSCLEATQFRVHLTNFSQALSSDRSVATLSLRDALLGAEELGPSWLGSVRDVRLQTRIAMIQSSRPLRQYNLRSHI